MHINSKADPAKNVNQSLFVNVKRKLTHEQKEKHIFGDNLSVNFFMVITAFFAGFRRGVMDRGKGTPDVSGAPVCSCRLQPSQVQLYLLSMNVDLQSPLKSLQKKQVLQRSPVLDEY